MAHKKAYSRYFIILQEDEKGCALASDKQPSGYAKIEIKNDKCKITYYVQNLKKDKEPYYMLLICNKKDMKKLINIGILNIDDHGRAEITFECNIDNIGSTGISTEKISGAAIIKKVNDRIIMPMSGFASTDIPGDWKSYVIVEHENKREAEEERKKEEVNINEEIKNNPEKEEEKKVIEEMKIEVELEDNVRTAEEEITEGNSIDFKEYEDMIEKEKDREKVKEEVIEEKVEENNRDTIEAEPITEKEGSEEEPITEKEIVKEEPIMERGIVEEEPIAGSEIIEEEPITGSEIVEEEPITERGIVEEEPMSEKERIEEDYKEVENNEDPMTEQEVINEVIKEEDYPRGSVGEFFEAVVDGFEETRGVCPEIKKCKWYKVPVANFDVMCNISNYNKYTIIYYPMINYYPYIKKYGHYMVGFKCDSQGRMKYLVYAIPGTKDKPEQPYGGKSGFVTWVPEKSKDNRETHGYWIMFYDFKNSIIVVPMK